MKNKRITTMFLRPVLAAAVAFACLPVFTGCGDDDGGGGGISYSVQVKNGAATKAIGSGDTVELYIKNLEYHNTNTGALILIANGDRSMGTKGGILDNAGWYKLDSDLKVENDVNNAYFPWVELKVSGLRIGGEGGTEHPISGMDERKFENFSGLDMVADAHSLKTIITVDKDIVDDLPNAKNYIKVEGRVNE